jgi:oligopeptide transport system substrate-binding protein
VHEQIAIELQAMWQRELNLRVDLRKLEWKVFLNTQGRLEYDLCRSSWIGDYNDATTFLDMFTSDNGNNRTGWRSAPYDGLLRSAAGQSDPRTRARLLQDAERLLVEAQAPIAPLYFYVGFNRFDPQLIRGVYQNLRDEHPLRAIRKVPRPVGPPRAATASSSPVAQLPSGD